MRKAGISPDPRTDAKISAFPAHLEEESLPFVRRPSQSEWNHRHWYSIRVRKKLEIVKSWGIRVVIYLSG
jgi:hypothetical protein